MADPVITNGYTTLPYIKALLDITSTDATDDGALSRMIEQASRFIDDYTGRTFYARTETHYFDVPGGRELMMDDDLLSITTLTNGDDNAIASTEYNLVPMNSNPKYAIKLKQSSAYYWNGDGSNTEKVISVAGTWGYSATTPMDIAQACEEITIAMRNRRTGANNEGQVKVTGAGVVITPQSVPSQVRELLNKYKRRT